MAKNLPIWKQVSNSRDWSEIRAARLQQLIDVMQRVEDEGRAFDMRCSQRTKGDDFTKESEDELKASGNAASVAGWLGVSPEFIKAGGYICCHTGIPVIRRNAHNHDDHDIGGNAILAFLRGSPVPEEERGMSNNLGRSIESPASSFYAGIYADDIEPCDVLERLHYIQGLHKNQKQKIKKTGALFSAATGMLLSELAGDEDMKKRMEPWIDVVKKQL